MKIVMIGSGNVAWNLGKLFQLHEHEVVQIISSNAATASELAYELNTESANYFSIINKEADLYVIAVNDDAIAWVVDQMIGLNKLVVHTSGAVPIDVLAKASDTYGSLYPVQTMIYGTLELPTFSFLIQGNTDVVEKRIQAFVQTLQSDVSVVTNEDKLKLHIGAVFVNNFTNHLYTLTFDWCKQNGLDFRLLLPLIKETVHKMELEYDKAIKDSKPKSPHLFQTGPAIRNDKVTIAKHKETLNEDPKLLAFYDLFTKSIMGNL